jgi:hypothetical protein
MREAAGRSLRFPSPLKTAVRQLLFCGLLCALLVPSELLAAPRPQGTDLAPAVIRVQTPAYQLDTAGVSVAGYGWSDQPGAPRLPVYATLIELPPNGASTGGWQLSYASAGPRVLEGAVDVPAVPVPRLTLPGPETWTESTELPGSVPMVDEPDAAIYGADAFYPAAPVIAGQEQRQRDHRYLAVRVFPFQYNPVKRQLLYNPDVTITVTLTPDAAQTPSADGVGPAEATAVTDEYGRTPAAQVAASSDAAGDAVRVRTTARGVYRITYAQLSAAGVPVTTVDPASFYMTCRGNPVSIQVTGASDGHFDSGDLVIFYAEPYVGRWQVDNVYRFFYASTPAPASTRMTTRAVPRAGPVVTTITQTQHLENDAAYYSKYHISAEADHIFDNALAVFTNKPGVADVPSITRSYTLALDDPVNTGGKVKVTGLLYGGRVDETDPNLSNTQSVKISLNSHLANTLQWDGPIPYTPALTLPVTWLDASPNQIVLEAALTQVPGALAYTLVPDWLDFSYPALADAEGDRIYVEGFVPNGNSAEVHVTGFTTDIVHVYDVRNPAAPVEIMEKQAVNGAAPYEIRFWDAWNTGDPAAQYFLTTDAALMTPTVEPDVYANLRDPGRVADYIAIVHRDANANRDLWAAIQPLLDLRAGQGLRVAKVDLQDVYDEFNHGFLHPNAIRDFLKYAYNNWNAGQAPPKYVLLVGDGTYDFKNVLKQDSLLPNLLPPYLIDIDPWMMETAADNRFVTFDGPADYMPEMAIGRIPARDITEVQAVVTKILDYEDTTKTPNGAWQSNVYYTADENSGYVGYFHNWSKLSRDLLPAPYADAAIYFGLTSPFTGAPLNSTAAMNSAINTAFNSGAVFLQWFGHASQFRWGYSISMYNIFQPATLTANTRLPFTASFSCLAGWFINMIATGNGQSLAERLILEPHKASIADLSPSGYHYGEALVKLNQGLTRALFIDHVTTVGDAVNAAKLYYDTQSGVAKDVVDTTVLFGDPALKLRLPMPVAPAVAAASATSAGITVSWPHDVLNTTYTLWRSENPYFDPATQGVQLTTIDASGYAAGAPVQYADNGQTPPPAVITYGDPAHNYFWVVRAANAYGTSSTSNRVGEFDFSLTPGQ